MVSAAGLNLCRDPADNCIVILRKEAYEFFYPGESSKDSSRMFPQFKPFRKLQYPRSYRNHPEAFNTLLNLVDIFFNSQIKPCTRKIPSAATIVG